MLNISARLSHVSTCAFELRDKYFQKAEGKAMYLDWESTMLHLG